MSDNKKYYYLKLKDNFFESGNYSIVESLEALELIQTIEEII